MTTPKTRFDLPPSLARADGKPRRVGFELEFTGLTIDQATVALQSALGGEARTQSAAERVLRVNGLGEFNIELDWDFLKRKAAVAADEAADGDQDGEKDDDSGREWIGLLSDAASLVVPLEVVCPPIPIGKLDALDAMVSGLRAAGAVGTENSPLAAYGTHVNAEIASLDPATISAYLRAFALLQWWLVDAHEVDITRKISPYIDLYPEAYLESLARRSEHDLERIFDDYLEHNATRNRALDLLPMLAHIDAARVQAAVNDPKVKPRPAFHYRLPNCHIEQPDWSLARAWNLWCVVERLAGREGDVDELGAAFLERSRPVLGVVRADWVAHVDTWLKERELA